MNIWRESEGIEVIVEPEILIVAGSSALSLFSI
jgi:hypothetical protein